jgi:hypothetical protein
LVFLVSPLDGSAGDPVPLLAAGEAEGRLVLRETGHYRRMAERCAEVQLYARSTSALHLAVRGRPLVRGEEEWERARLSCDVGEPEGLAYNIGVFERVAREDGWRVEGPSPSPSSGSGEPSRPVESSGGNSDAGGGVHVVG